MAACPRRKPNAPPGLRKETSPPTLSILERGGHGAISEPVKDWTTRQKTKNWTRTEGETGRTIGQKIGQLNLTPAILERGGHGAISGPVKDWTTRQKMKIWTRTEGETGRTIGQKVGQQAPRAAGQYCISIDQAGGWQVNARWNGMTQSGGG